jgi:hypothetical protein
MANSFRFFNKHCACVGSFSFGGWKMFFFSVKYNSWTVLRKTQRSKMSTFFGMRNLGTCLLTFFLSALMTDVAILATAVGIDCLSDIFLAELASWVDVCNCDSKGPLSNPPSFPLPNIMLADSCRLPYQLGYLIYQKNGDNGMQISESLPYHISAESVACFMLHGKVLLWSYVTRALF